MHGIIVENVFIVQSACHLDTHVASVCIAAIRELHSPSIKHRESELCVYTSFVLDNEPTTVDVD